MVVKGYLTILRAGRAIVVGALASQIALAASLAAQQTPPAIVTTSEYAPTRDGTRLAVDVHLPSTRTAGERLPALLELTRYWCASEDATTGARRPSLFVRLHTHVYLRHLRGPHDLPRAR